ncbi:hypothetical protein [Methylobacterium sp. J-090]|uniref:hypothetical protein n=1 Tax=Methylobacterium sp. J-090 TaxID=2836666 RepID=UPI001FBB9E08|nr:hypothetical protein [Methylobacterium sp. J-090]MCJ2083938.1 hypothetical protein [Methylobacterium sp. J-090]
MARDTGTPLPTPSEPRPMGWGRLGLTALLGFLAGTLLLPTPARGRSKRTAEQGRGLDG